MEKDERKRKSKDKGWTKKVGLVEFIEKRG